MALKAKEEIDAKKLIDNLQKSLDAFQKHMRELLLPGGKIKEGHEERLKSLEKAAKVVEKELCQLREDLRVQARAKSDLLHIGEDRQN